MAYEVIARFEGGFMNTFTYDESWSIEKIAQSFKEANKRQNTFKAVVLTVKCLDNNKVEVIDL